MMLMMSNAQYFSLLFLFDVMLKNLVSTLVIMILCGIEINMSLMSSYFQVLNTSEKSKSKGARNGDLVAPKAMQQPPSQVVNHAVRLPGTKSDILKTSQTGNFLVLNREKNGISPTAKDGPSPAISSRAITSLGSVSSASSPHSNSSANSKLKANGVGGEKKPQSQAKDRNHFFNSLRKQAELKNGVPHHPSESNCGSSSSSSLSASAMSNLMMKSDEQVTGDSAISACQGKEILGAYNSGIRSSIAENGSMGDEEPETFVAPDEEEKAFLKSLGWNENAGEGALTAEEIESFVKKVKQILISFIVSLRNTPFCSQ